MVNLRAAKNSGFRYPEPSRAAASLLVNGIRIYIDQVRMKSNINGHPGWSKLRSSRIIKILGRSCGQNYHPRFNDYKQQFRNGVSTNRRSRRNPNHRSLKTGIPKSFTRRRRETLSEAQTAFEDCPMPITATEPSLKPDIINHQNALITKLM